MKTIALITMKYWKKHLKSAVALLFSGVLLTAIIFAALMSLREECVRFYERAFDNMCLSQTPMTSFWRRL